jgi:hypothetical protein
VLALVAGYALAIQTLLLGVVGASQAARATDGTADYIICLAHEGVAKPAPSDVPDQHSECAANCILCAGAVHTVALPPLGASLGLVSATGEVLRWHRPDWQISVLFDSPVVQPRGPPLAA